MEHFKVMEMADSRVALNETDTNKYTFLTYVCGNRESVLELM